MPSVVSEMSVKLRRVRLGLHQLLIVALLLLLAVWQSSNVQASTGRFAVEPTHRYYATLRDKLAYVPGLAV